MNNLPISSFICAENKYSHSILKFNCSLHIYHIQKHLKSTVSISQCLYAWLWGLAYFFCYFKAQGVILDPLNA